MTEETPNIRQQVKEFLATKLSNGKTVFEWLCFGLPEAKKLEQKVYKKAMEDGLCDLAKLTQKPYIAELRIEDGSFDQQQNDLQRYDGMFPLPIKSFDKIEETDVFQEIENNADLYQSIDSDLINIKHCLLPILETLQHEQPLNQMHLKDLESLNGINYQAYPSSKAVKELTSTAADDVFIKSFLINTVKPFMIKSLENSATASPNSFINRIEALNKQSHHQL